MVSMARGISIVSLGLFSLATTLIAQQHYKQTNLISNIPGMAAATDPNLVNPWGISRSSGSPWWVSDNGQGVATLYTGAGAINPLVVTIPAADSGPGTPTGTIFNGSQDFQLAPKTPALFLFV